MTIAIRKEPNGSMYLDKHLRAEIDYTSSPYNFTLIDIDNQYKDCEASDFNDDLTFSVEKYELRKNAVKYQQELQQFENWFDKYFQPQLIQSMWQTGFKVSKDMYFKDENGEPLTYATIDDLKAKGEEVRSRIKELRNYLTNDRK